MREMSMMPDMVVMEKKVGENQGSFFIAGHDGEFCIGLIEFPDVENCVLIFGGLDEKSLKMIKTVAVFDNTDLAYTGLYEIMKGLYPDKYSDELYEQSVIDDETGYGQDGLGLQIDMNMYQNGIMYRLANWGEWYDVHEFVKELRDEGKIGF